MPPTPNYSSPPLRFSDLPTFLRCSPSQLAVAFLFSKYSCHFWPKLWGHCSQLPFCTSIIGLGPFWKSIYTNFSSYYVVQCLCSMDSAGGLNKKQSVISDLEVCLGKDVAWHRNTVWASWEICWDWKDKNCLAKENFKSELNTIQKYKFFMWFCKVLRFMWT